MISYKTYLPKEALKKLIKVKKCMRCGISIEENFDPNDNKLYDFQLVFRDGNPQNQKENNLGFLCRRCLGGKKKGTITPYQLFRGSGRVH